MFTCICSNENIIIIIILITMIMILIVIIIVIVHVVVMSPIISVEVPCISIKLQKYFIQNHRLLYIDNNNVN